jgi:sulfur-oxidizing protein SoxA
MKRTTIPALLASAVLLMAAVAGAQEKDPNAESRELMGDENPAVFWEMRGEDLWKTKRGPRNADLSKCDLGLGKGVIKGAYAQLPRYFKDAGRVMDLEGRIVHCVTTLQGIPADELLKVRFGDGDDKRSEMEALTAYVVAASRGVPMNTPSQHPKEKAAYALGKQIFYYRSGPHDFGCVTCHAQSGKRIRLQALPQLTNPDEAKAAYTTWPGYRISQGELRTMEWRLNDCFRQQRLPDLQYGSEVAVALTMFLAKNAEGGVMNAPAMKR